MYNTRKLDKLGGWYKNKEMKRIKQVGKIVKKCWQEKDTV